MLNLVVRKETARVQKVKLGGSDDLSDSFAEEQIFLAYGLITYRLHNFDSQRKIHPITGHEGPEGV